MPVLESTHVGWTSERIAQTLLGQFSFIACPTVPGDDIGVDFICTIYHPIEKQGKNGKYKLLVPESSFAIQIKSNNDTFEFTNWEYLWHLEIPFFVGVVNREDGTLTVYSGEYAPSLFSFKGRPDKLTIQLCNTIINRKYFAEPGPAHYELMCPKVTQLSFALTSEQLDKKVGTIRDRCEYMQRNLAARISHEYTFFYPDHIQAMAGKTSARHFRHNFLIRLDEVGQNLHWIYHKTPDEFSYDEFKIYYDLLRKLETLYHPVPRDLINTFESLQGEISASGFAGGVLPNPKHEPKTYAHFPPVNSTETEFTPISDHGLSVASWYQKDSDDDEDDDQ